MGYLYLLVIRPGECQLTENYCDEFVLATGTSAIHSDVINVRSTVADTAGADENCTQSGDSAETEA